MRKILLVGLFLQSVVFAQQEGIEVIVHNRVDTTQKEVRQIVALWKNYLNSKPDSIYDNPYWNEAEKQQYKDFDFTRQFIYQFPSQQLLRYYKPTILSVTPKHRAYAIRTLFYADEVSERGKTSNPWCITELYAVKEHNRWKLKNAFPVITQTWNHTTLGGITFIYPKQHEFNRQLAEKAATFCDSIVNRFNLPDWKPFDFYITSSPDQMGRLLGFDFYFVGYATGMGWRRVHKLFSGMGSEWYPHEFVHLILPDKRRHFVIEEGFATWQGGAQQRTFKENASLLARKLARSNTVSFADILHRKWGRQFSARYTMGAIICQQAWKKGGAAAVKKLLNVPPDNQKLTEALCTLFDIREHEVTAFIRERVAEYAGKTE